jgi:hypothetical protein
MVPSPRPVVFLAVAGLTLASAAGVAQSPSGLPPETLAQSIPLFAFHSQGNHGAAVLARSGGEQEHDPIIFVASADGWQVVQLPEQFHNTGWIFAGRATTRDELWGITQGSVGGPGPTLQFVSSSNGGRSWRLRGSLSMVSRFAVVDLFSVNDDGKGTLILRLDDDPSPDAPRLGYYFYLTKNGGRTWSEAIYSQNRPLPPPVMILPADRTFDGKQAFDADAWERLFASLQPAQ